MTAEKLRAEICKVICGRFINSHAGTDHRSLVLKFEQPQVLSQLVDNGFLEDPTNRRETYFPRIRALVLAGDADLLNRVKTGIVIVVPALRQLFVKSDKPQWTWEQLLDQALEMNDSLNEDTVRLGLYFSRELGVVGSYQMNDTHTAITQFSINESIVSVHNPEDWLEEKLASYTPKPNVKLTPTFSPGVDRGLDTAFGLGQRTLHVDFDWSLIHPEIRKVAESRFTPEHFADSIEAALKAVNDRIRKIYKAERGLEKDGADLMHAALSATNPVFRLGDLDTVTGRDIQKGYMEIFAGAMTGIRNQMAHHNVQIDPVPATHLLFLTSLLMYKLDEAEVVKLRPATTS